MVEIESIFKNACPNCMGDIRSSRLIAKLPCKKCLDEIPSEINVKTIANFLKKKGHLIGYITIARFREEYEKFIELFKEITGHHPWGPQKSWARRAISGRSFAIMAPTGLGKTTFGMVFSIFIGRKGMKSYIIVPTTVLVSMITERIRNFAGDLRVVSYHSDMKSKEKKEALDAISNGNFDILVTTSAFLTARFEILEGKKFDFIFIDDVDSFLKNSRNIDKVIELAGVSRNVIDRTWNQIISYFKKKGKSEEEEEEEETEETPIDEASEKHGIVIVSTASARVRYTPRTLLFRRLLGFDVGRPMELTRNIVHVYDITGKDEREIIKRVIDTVSKLGKGGLIFVPMDHGKERALEIAKELCNSGIQATAEITPEAIEKFSRGGYAVLVGMAFHAGPLARGIDLPGVVRYVIFAGVPKFKITVKMENMTPGKAILLLSAIRRHLPDKEKITADKYINMLRRVRIKRDEDPMEHPVMKRVVTFLSRILENKEIQESLLSSPRLEACMADGIFTILIPDVSSYVQASGRCSRLYAGGITKGLAITFVDSEKAFTGLKEGLSFYTEEEWHRIEEVDLEKIMSEIDKEREMIKEGKIEEKFAKELKTVLLVVESPNKAKTIARFFGKPNILSVDGVTVYEVFTGNVILNITATAGHIFDLVTKDGEHGILRENGLFIPVYGTLKKCPRCGEVYTDPIDKCPRCNLPLLDKSGIVRALRTLAMLVDEVYIGTDADAEGEKIAWDIYNIIRPYADKISRLEFHEVTKRAILDSIKNTRDINTNLVKAQIVRRVEDRWIGFKLSQKLWSVMGRKTLSAGRVQTPVLGWIVEQHRRWKESISAIGTFIGENLTFTIVLPRDQKERLESLADKCRITREETWEENVFPPPPFTTDTMIKEASTRLGFSAPHTMQLAQELFEGGLITYHRTDSTRVSDKGMSIAKSYITAHFGPEYFSPRKWEEKGAHECIRPTRPMDVSSLLQMIHAGLLKLPFELTRDHIRLYRLIFERFIASQMPPALVHKQRVHVSAEELSTTVERTVNIIKPGFLALMRLKTWPPLTLGPVSVKNVEVRVAPTVLPYTHGEVIALMKERGIGRPSTYAIIIQKLLDRNYIKETKTGRLRATGVGIEVYNFLKAHYGKHVSEETTRRLEEIMDAVERGEKDYQEVLSQLYAELKEL